MMRRKPWAFAPPQQKSETGAPPKLKAGNAVDGRPEIFIYDYIDAGADEYWGGVSAAMVREALDGLTNVTVRINSPGGDVREGIAILNCLRLHQGHVRVQVDGLAASAASFIAMAGNEIVMMPNTEMMIHDASMFSYGNAEELRADALYLDRVSVNIADIYGQRAGGTAAEWRARMLAETWYSAEEAVAAGLADSVMDIEPTAGRSTALKAIGNTWDIPYARYAGRLAAPDPVIVDVIPKPIPEPIPAPEAPSDYAAFLNALSKEAVT